MTVATTSTDDWNLPVELDADRDGRYDDIDNVPAEDGQGPDAGGEVVPYDREIEPWAPSPLRGPVGRLAGRPLPTRASFEAGCRWWARNLSIAGVNLVVRSPQLGLQQVPHIYRGTCKCGRTYADWRTQTVWLAAALAAEDKNLRAKQVAAVKRRQRANTRITWLTTLAVVGASVWAYAIGYGWYLVGAVGFMFLVLDLLGRRGAPAGAVAILPRSHFQEGAPSAMAMADVRAVLIGRGHDTETTVITEPKVGKYGLSMTVHSTRPVDDEDCAAIERGIQAYRGAVQIVGDPDNAALTEIRAFWTDPLATSASPLRLAPRSVSIAVPAVLGYGIGHVPLELPLMRVNVGIVGGPGSGKSSTLWTIIDWLSCCKDVVLHGIDLSGGPAIRSWGDVFTTRAFDAASAKKLLVERIGAAIARTHVLAERSEPKPGASAPKSENWTPEDAANGLGLFHVLIIDELPLLANDPELVALLAEHQRIGRKAGETSIWAAQDMTKETLGATSIRKYPSTTILHACSRDDVTNALGGGKVQEGWAPHRLTPAEGDDVNDAGKAYIKSGRHTKPVPWRFARLDDPQEIWDRALERIAAGMPAEGEDAIRPVEIDSAAVVVPDVLAATAAVFREAGCPEFLSTERILEMIEATAGTTFTTRVFGQKMKAIKPNPVPSTRERFEGSKNAVAGYRWEVIAAAMDALEPVS